MALDGFPDVYDWICHLQPTLKDESLQLTSVDRSVIYMHAYSDGNGVVFLSLWWDYGCLAELGEFRIEECSEEEMQENLFPLFFNLCVYAFLGVTRKVIATMALWPFSYRLDRLSLKKFMKHNMPSSWRSEEHMLSSSRLGFSWPKDEVDMVRMATDGLQRLGIGSGTVESAIFKRAFNSIFRAASYSHALQAKTQLTTRVDLEMQKFWEQIRKETLVIIGPDATHRLMKFLATKFAEISLRYGSESINPFEVSYSSRLGRYWTLNAYCPRLSMQLQVPSNQDKKKDALLELALSHQLMHCLIHFNHGVTFYRDWIDVELHIDNLRCQAFQLDSNKPIPSNLEKEWYFPAKIALTIWPEYKSGVHAVSLGASSQNPQVTVTRERSEEASLKAEQAIGTKVDSSLGAEFKVGRKISFSNRLNNWVFDLSAVNNTGGRLEWTLYDNSYGMPVFSYTPPQFKFWNGSTWSTGNSFKAFRAFAQEQGSVRPFTPGGGVVFARDVYGTPITWRLNRDLEGQTLKWIVEGEIWFAYYPNKYHTQYMEIRSHKFCEQVELPLLQS